MNNNPIEQRMKSPPLGKTCDQHYARGTLHRRGGRPSKRSTSAKYVLQHDDWQYTGNTTIEQETCEIMISYLQGYEDIDSQRKAENSYKFQWNEDMLEDIESKITSLGGDLDEPGIGGEAIAVENDPPKPEEVTLSDQENFDGLLGVHEERGRPSSKHSKIEESETEDGANIPRDDL